MIVVFYCFEQIVGQLGEHPDIVFTVQCIVKGISYMGCGRTKRVGTDVTDELVQWIFIQLLLSAINLHSLLISRNTSCHKSA